MAELVAQSDESGRRWRRNLPRHQEVILGRGSCQWPVPWDGQISRQHASLFWDGIQLTVKRLPQSKNPLFYKGKQVQQCSIKPVDHFVIGKTSFTLVQSTVGATVEMPNPAKEKLFSRKSLNEVRFRDAERRLAILSDLPEVISSANNDAELFVRLCNVIFGGVSMAASVGVVSFKDPKKKGNPTDESPDDPNSDISVLHWDRRFNEVANFQPSSRLIHSSISSEQSVLHIWDDPESTSALTMIDPAHDWAFCTPIPSSEKPNLAFYVSGATGGGFEQASGSTVADSLKEDIKYTELVAKIAGSLRKVRNLQTRQASLRSFFSPVVLDQMQTQDPSEVLRPRECDVSILFCDLRGFSAVSEQMSGKLMQLLHQVSDALGVTTRHILDQGGVVGDFHGDATMGFWGWPVEQKDQVHRACLAALSIHKDFLQLAAQHQASQEKNSSARLQVGLGIASGTAVAGQIGTSDQVKVTAFGPVVNLAARLETMNRQLNTSILIDQQTLDRLNEEEEFLPSSSKRLQFRTRSLGKVLPVGLSQPIEVAEVLPPSEESDLTDKDLSSFSVAMDHFSAGRWEEAYQALHEVPAHDRTKDLLTFLITQQNRQAPSNWDGIIRLHQK